MKKMRIRRYFDDGDVYFNHQNITVFTFFFVILSGWARVYDLIPFWVIISSA
jgi:hypothetical protein